MVIACMQGYDVMEEMYNEKTAAMNFVHELCKCRTKGNLEAFMTLCINVMNEYNVRPVCPFFYVPIYATGATHLRSRVCNCSHEIFECLLT